MAESAFQALRFMASQPWAWMPIVAVAAIMARDVIRLLVSVWSLSIVLRGTAGRDRARVLKAYAACVTVRQVTQPPAGAYAQRRNPDLEPDRAARRAR